MQSLLLKLLILSGAAAFSGALFALIPAGGAVQKALCLGLAILVMLAGLAYPWPRRSVSLIWVMPVLVAFGFLSALSHSSSLLYALAAAQSLVIGVVVYLACLMLTLDARTLAALKRTFLALCVIQIVFAFLKLVTHGIDEKVLIGTMSHAAGQLGFLFPAIAAPLTIFLLRDRPSRMYLMLAGLLVFGVINEKRSVVFLLPIVILAAVWLNAPQSHDIRGRARRNSWIPAALIGCAGSAIGLMAMPSLNPDAGYSGSFDPMFAINYAITYLTMDYGGPLQASYEEALRDVNVQVGRFVLAAEIVRWLQEADTMTLLVGLGFGTVTPSEWLGTEGDRLFDVLGTRGAISGAGLAVLETGLLGLALYVMLFAGAVQAAWAERRRARTRLARNWFGTVLVLIGVFAYDFFFYSLVLLRTLPMPFIFFGVLASIPLVARWDRVQTAATPRASA